MPATTPAQPTDLADRPLRRGQKGPRVRTWQQLLRGKGFALDLDGVFGPKTLNATRVAQQWAGVKVDGIVGPVTWAAVTAKMRTPRKASAARAVLGFPRVIDARHGRAGFPHHATRTWEKRNAALIVAVCGHHTGGPASFVADAGFHVRSNYLTRGGAPAIAYCLGVDLDGTLFVFNDWDDITWHCDGGHNTDTLGVVARGNTDQTRMPLPQRRTLSRVLSQIEAGSFRPFRSEPAWPRIRVATTHRHVNATGCPGEVGESFYRAAAKRFVTEL